MTNPQYLHSQSAPSAGESEGSPHPERVVRVTQIAKKYGQRVVLRDVSFDARRGEVIGLLGANGSGKSTVLRIVAGLEDPDRGEVCVPRGTGTAMIFQKMHLVPRRSALENVCAGGLARVPAWRSLTFLPFPTEHKREAAGCLSRVGLYERAHTRAGDLSGGEQQRVAVARALCQRPKVILADEPTAALDPTAAHRVMGLLRDVATSRRIACICVIHQPELAAQYCDTLVGLAHGRVVFRLPAREVSPQLVAALYSSAGNQSTAEAVGVLEGAAR